MSGWLGGGKNTKQQPKYTGLSIQTSTLGKPITIMWGKARIAPNIIWYNGFTLSFTKRKGGKGGGGGGKGGKDANYSVAIILALCEGPIQSVGTVYQNQSTTTLAGLGLTLFTGTPSQVPPGFITTLYPAQARSYARTAYVVSPSYQLGSQPNLPTNAFEVVGNLSGTMPGTTDVNPGDVINDLLSNVQYGLGLTSGNVDATSLAFYTTYCRAQGLFFSPVLDGQDKGTSILDRWAELTNSWIFWSGDVIKFAPLGDVAITANGATYTPITTIQYALGVDDFLDQQMPVKVTRKDPADCYNRTAFEIENRGLSYNSFVCEFKDQTLIDLYGLRDASSTAAKEYKDTAIGQIAVTLKGKRNAYLRNTYEFKTSYRFVRLEPGDLVTLTEPNIPLNGVPVRILTVDEDESGSLSFTAEEYTGSIGSIVAPPSTASAPSSVDRLIAPGDVNPPAIFEPSAALDGTQQVWVSVSGGANWGGADVYFSADNNTYTFAGTIVTPAKQGVLTATLAGHADPDTVNTLSVDLTQSLGILNPVTHADADALRTLSLVGPLPVAHVIQTANIELLAYGTVAPTGTYTSDLTYLRRGKYGTVPVSHASGQQFTLLDPTGLDGSTLNVQLPAQYVGATLYVKFLSYNIYGLAQQDLASVTAYQYTPTGAGFGGGSGGVPGTPTGLSTAVSSTLVEVAWDPNPASDGVTSYKVFRAAGTGASFGTSVLIATIAGTNYVDLGLAPSTGYTYFVEAVNAVGASAATAGANATTGANASGQVSYFGTGAPSTLHNEGDLYFDTTVSTYVEYVQHSGAWHLASSSGSSLEIDWLGTPIDTAAVRIDIEGQLTANVATDGSHHVTITLNGMLPLVTGVLPGPDFMVDPSGQCIGVPL